MKTNEMTILALIGVGACSFFFGLGQQETSAQVQNCTVSCCEDLYSWWINGNPGGTQCFSAQAKGQRGLSVQDKIPPMRAFL